MKMKKILSVLFAPVILVVLTMNCTNEDDAITESVKDVSSRVTGFGSSATGAGASLTVNGSNLDKVVRICVGDYCVPQRLFTSVSESSVVFTVPTAVPTGEDTPVLLVFPGSERAYALIDVVPLPAIIGFTPYGAATGETVTVFGTNFDIVSGVKLGDVSGTITSQTSTVLKFTVPAGITTGKISLISPAGSGNSTQDLIACTANPAVSDCVAGVNLNWGFELGSGDNFDNWNKFNGGTLMTATTNANEVYRGSRAMKVVRDGTLASGQWRIQLASDLTAMDVGASYTVYVWAKATVAGGAMRVSTAPTALYTGDQSVPTTWTRLAFTFTANETPARIVLDMNGNNTAATTFYIDDVKLIKN